MKNNITFIMVLCIIHSCVTLNANNTKGLKQTNNNSATVIWKYYNFNGVQVTSENNSIAFAIASHSTHPNASVEATSNLLPTNVYLQRGISNQIAVMNQLWYINKLEGVLGIRLYYTNNSKTSALAAHTNPLTQQAWCIYNGNINGFLQANTGDVIDAANVIRPKGYGSMVDKSYVEFTNITANTTIAYITKSSLYATLPALKLTYYNVVEQQCLLHLKWGSENEEVSAQYIIEKSIDGIEYVELDTINGKGDYKHYTHSIEYTNDIIYCRLKVINASGAITYGSNAKVYATCNGQSLTLFPNPVKETAFISGLKNGSSITVLNAKGTVVAKLTNQRNIEPIKVSNWLPGIYFIEVKGDAKATNKQLLKLIKE